MIEQQIRLKQDFYSTLNEMMNAKDIEEFGYKSIRASFVLRDLRNICTKCAGDVLVDELVQAISYFASVN